MNLSKLLHTVLSLENGCGVITCNLGGSGFRHVAITMFFSLYLCLTSNQHFETLKTAFDRKKSGLSLKSREEVCLQSKEFKKESHRKSRKL